MPSTEIYTLSLHGRSSDLYCRRRMHQFRLVGTSRAVSLGVSPARRGARQGDRKSTRLNSSHANISYAVHRDLHSFPTRTLFRSLLPPPDASVSPGRYQSSGQPRCKPGQAGSPARRSEEHTSELQSRQYLVCRPPRSTLFPYTDALPISIAAAGCISFAWSVPVERSA